MVNKYQILKMHLYVLLMMGEVTTRNMWRIFPEIYKLCKVASRWNYIKRNILTMRGPLNVRLLFWSICFNISVKHFAYILNLKVGKQVPSNPFYIYTKLQRVITHKNVIKKLIDVKTSKIINFKELEKEGRNLSKSNYNCLYFVLFFVGLTKRKQNIDSFVLTYLNSFPLLRT